jgi:hypothetical protein
LPTSLEGLLDQPNAKIHLSYMKPNTNEGDNEPEWQVNPDDEPILCNETEAISGFSFAYLLAESSGAKKGLIIARVKTRSNVDFRKKFYHYFYAANLIQLLVKPNLSFLDTILQQNNQSIHKEDNKKHILRSRYHMDFPMTVKNPLTNQIIVGEVEFYLVQLKEIQEKTNKKNLPEDGSFNLNAYYIGSDYTYAYSQQFRDNVFRDNTLDENLLVGVNPRPVVLERPQGLPADDQGNNAIQNGDDLPPVDGQGAGNGPAPSA